MNKKKIHTTGKDIRRMYLGCVVIAVLVFLLGLYCILIITLNPTPQYKNLKEGTITVDHIKYYPGSGRFASGYYGLTSAEGVKYHLSGNFDIHILQEKLMTGTEISIKWYSNNTLMVERFYIEEICLDGEMLSAYTNDDKPAIIFAWIGGSALFMIGIGSLIFYYCIVKKEIKHLPKKYRN